jgi:hypothetical protein
MLEYADVCWRMLTYADSRNHKQVEVTLAAPPTQPHLFSGKDLFPCLGVLSLRMRCAAIEALLRLY